MYRGRYLLSWVCLPAGHLALALHIATKPTFLREVPSPQPGLLAPSHTPSRPVALGNSEMSALSGMGTSGGSPNSEAQGREGVVPFLSPRSGKYSSLGSAGTPQSTGSRQKAPSGVGMGLAQQVRRNGGRRKGGEKEGRRKRVGD